QPADPAQKRAQVFAIHELHGDVWLAFDLANVVYAADIGMRHMPCQTNFADEPALDMNIVRLGFGQELQRDGLAELEVSGAINLAHTAAAEQADDPIAAGDHSARQKPAFVHGTGGDYARGHCLRRRLRRARQRRSTRTAEAIAFGVINLTRKT